MSASQQCVNRIMRYFICLSVLCMLLSSCSIIALQQTGEIAYVMGGIERGPIHEKKIALVFTGGSFAEGGDYILNILKEHTAKASFFFTGDFFRNPEFEGLIHRIVREGHYVGPHSSRHLLYCPWENRAKTLVSEEEFKSDIRESLVEVRRFGIDPEKDNYWIPPYEWYNDQISRWSDEMGLILINFTPGTHSNADYTGEADKNFRSSEFIYNKILEKESTDPYGLNGFLLLMHIGAGTGRTDKFFYRLDDLLTELEQRGYSFIRVDTMLDPIVKK